MKSDCDKASRRSLTGREGGEEGEAWAREQSFGRVGFRFQQTGGAE